MMKKLLKNKVAMICAFVLCGMVSFGLGYGSGGSEVTEARAEAERAETKVERAQAALARSELLAEQVSEERNRLYRVENDICLAFRQSMVALSDVYNHPKDGPIYQQWHNTGVEHCSFHGFPLE